MGGVTNECLGEVMETEHQRVCRRWSGWEGSEWW